IMEDGTEICGETNIVGDGRRIRRIFLDPENAAAHKGALEAIRAADLICIGPGSVYTSVIPNLLVPGIAEAIRDSSAVRVYICNVMTQPGESDSFTASEHVTAIRANVSERVFDCVLVNTGVPSIQAVEKYRESGQVLVEPDIDRIRAMGFRVVPADYTSESDYVRHDPMRVANRLMRLIE
ncbi:MAG: gluconeogenesis factor YvcK family protein, partial [Fimbriimonadaceae bacterium]